MNRGILHTAYTDYSDIENVVGEIELLSKKISEDFIPDLIVQVSDISSPGGMILGSELQRLFEFPPAIVTARVFKDKNERNFTDIVGIPNLVNKKILIVDDVIFSGSTVLSVIAKVKEMYFDSQIAVASIVVHKFSEAKKIISESVDKLFYTSEIIGREIKFPWGIAEWYGSIPMRFGDTDVEIELMKRPWGFFEDYATNRECTVRTHYVSPHQEMSLHKHEKRDELFIVIDSGCSCTLDDKRINLFKGDKVFVPRGVWHRLSNDSHEVTRVVEVAFGEYDQIGDIKRKTDNYGREKLDGSI